MAATSGGTSSRPLPWYPLNWTLPELQESEIIGEEKLPGEEEMTAVDMAEMVPESLKCRIYPIMRTANAMDKFNRRVAFLCRFTAYEVMMTVEPDSSGRQARQFKTLLLNKLEKDEKLSRRRLAETDRLEIQRFYEQYHKNVKNRVEEFKNEAQKIQSFCEQYQKKLSKGVQTDAEETQLQTDAREIQRFYEQYHKKHLRGCQMENLDDTLRKIKEEMLQKIREEMLQKNREEALPEIREEILQRIRKEMLQKIGEELLQKIREETLPEIRKETMQKIKEEMLQKIREEMLQKIREETLPEIRKETMQKIREEMLQKISEEMLQKISEETLPEIREEMQKIREETLPKIREETLTEITEEKLQKDREETLQKIREEKLQKIRKEMMQKSREEMLQKIREMMQKTTEELLSKINKKMTWHSRIARVLYDVLKYVAPEKYHPEFDDNAKGSQKENVSSSKYNILPIDEPLNSVMQIPEIKAATELLRIDNLPKPNIDLSHGSDLFDWLRQTFGFQKGNMENQKEHLIFLLGNIDMRKRGEAHQNETHKHVIHNDTVTYLMKKVFHNYVTWCQYLHLESNIKIPRGASTQQPELLYIGLYLLIWGEASNVRFMPECLCYIFHHMAQYLFHFISMKREATFDPPFGQEGSKDAFLQSVIQPIFIVMQKEATMSKDGTTSHSRWRNYDDLNEYFWSDKCFKQLNWPMDHSADFFAVHTKSKDVMENHDHVITRERILKMNYVELRTFFILFRTFDRMWAFFILAFQAMIIIAWSPSGSISSIFEPTVFRNVMTIFITHAFLNFLQGALDIVLNWKAWRSLECTQMIRYILKFAVALSWLIILPTTFLYSGKHPTNHVKLFSISIGSLQKESIYNCAVTLYMLPNLFSALFFIFLPFRRALEYSNSSIVRFFLWWFEPKLYIARGMYEDTFSVLKYTIFWIILIICKLAFSFYVEISPLVGPSREMMFFGWGTNEHESFTYLQRNLGVIITIWAPAAMVYIMDTQIWYAIFSTICGAMSGAFSDLGQIKNLWRIRSSFEAIPRAFDRYLVPRRDGQSNRSELEGRKKFHTDEFSDTWNEFILSLRDQDLISNRERTLLVFPSSMATGEISVFQWPAFLLANKIQLAINMASRSMTEGELRKGIKNEPYTYDAIIECYETLLNILYGLVDNAKDKQVLDRIRNVIEDTIHRGSLVKEFRLYELSSLIPKFEKLLYLLRFGDLIDQDDQLVATLQDIIEIITQDIMKNGHGILRSEDMTHRHFVRINMEDITNQYFARINLDSIKYDRAWNEKCVRLQLLMTTRESAIYVPMNLEARRRIIFFANSIFMKMPKAPQVRRMMSFSVLTSYFKENVFYSEDDLWNKNESGISMLLYLRQIYPDEWKNFLERIEFRPRDEESLKLNMDEICHWASYRGQTLARTVRGMMYYRRALEIQCIQDKADLDKFDSDKILEFTRGAKAVADIKFTYVLSCHKYGMLEKSMDARDRISYQNILNLMTTYPALRVAYIDEVINPSGSGTETSYYSVLVKGVGHKSHEEIYRIKLPGKPTDIGEWKPEIQNHAIIFTRGEALQAININQDNYLEEAFKMRNVLEEFDSEKYGQSKPTILSMREHIFSGSVSSLAWFMFNQESIFATMRQRVLANYLRVGFHYGHSDIFDRLFHITRGGISKASKVLNLREGIFSGFNSIMRGGSVIHLEYMQVGKGLDEGMNQISSLEANMASGYGEQTLSRDIYRLGQRFDFYRMLSLYFTTVGFYFNSLVSVLTVYVFLYGRYYLVMKEPEKSILLHKSTQENIKPLERALASQSVFQLGFLLAFPILMEFCVETGFLKALGEFIIMQLHLASAFFTFQLGIRTHYYGRTILHGGGANRTTSHGCIAYHVKFAENYRLYSRSHFVKGLELLMLLVVYQVYGSPYNNSSLDRFLSFSIWFLVASWLYAPFVFNPLCFEWQKTVDDWTEWRMWMRNREGFGMSGDRSWKVWWKTEQQHLRKTSIHAFLLEVILSFRFLIYQFGIVNHLNIARTSQSTLVHALSGLVILSFLVVLKVDSIGQLRFGRNLQLTIHFLKALAFLGSVLMISILFIVAKFTIFDVFISMLGFIPTGWCIILIGQACSPFLKKTILWNCIVELARAYDSLMGAIIFLPIITLAWFPYVSEWQTRLLFDPALFRGLPISRILASQKKTEFD